MTEQTTAQGGLGCGAVEVDRALELPYKLYRTLMAHSPFQIRRTEVDLSGLMHVLGKNLYSTPTIVLRELVQNAHDSIVRRQVEDPSWHGEVDSAAHIRLSSCPQQGVLTIEDTGSGLTADEIVRFLATIGSGYTRHLRQEPAATPAARLIGEFGLGFLSAYVVANTIEVATTSYQEPDEGSLFTSQDGQSYTIRQTEPRAVGTKVRLTLKPQFFEFLDESVLTILVQRYCGLLHVPVFVGESAATPVNEIPPPWRLTEANPLRRRKAELDFARSFEKNFAPIATMPLPPSTGDKQQAGLLWIQDGASYATSDNRNVWVYVRGMLVSHDERDLLPTWAGFFGGVIESDDLVPTASRETLQKDSHYIRLQGHIHEALVTGLCGLAQESPEAWRRTLWRHNEALLGAALGDGRLFQLLARTLLLPTSAGQLSADAIAERANGVLNISLDEGGGAEKILVQALGVPVIDGGRFAALPFCQKFAEVFGVQLRQLGTKTGNASLFAKAPVSADTQAQLESLFGDQNHRVVASHFEPEHLPVVLVPDHDARLKRQLAADREDRNLSQAVISMTKLFTDTVDDTNTADLHVNMGSPLVQRLLRLSSRVEATQHVSEVLRAFAQLSALRSPHEQTMGCCLKRFSAGLTALCPPTTEDDHP